VDVEVPHPLERYHFYLSQYSYESAKNNLSEIIDKIKYG
jgi:hypothetical protein